MSTFWGFFTVAFLSAADPAMITAAQEDGGDIPPGNTCVLTLDPGTVVRGDLFTAEIQVVIDGEPRDMGDRIVGDFVAAFSIDGGIEDIIANGLLATLETVTLPSIPHRVSAEVRQPRTGVSIETLARLYKEVMRRQEKIHALEAQIEEGKFLLKRHEEIATLESEISQLRDEIDASSTPLASCDSEIVVLSNCTKEAFGISGDPALCLPKDKPTGQGLLECKEYTIKCCCIEEEQGDLYSAKLSDGKVTSITWTMPEFLTLQGVDGKSTVTAQGDKKFLSKLIGDEHSVKICVKLDLYDNLVKAIGKDCYAQFEIEMEGVCQEGETVLPVKMKLTLFVARPLKAKLCVRNVKKKGAADDDAANSTANLTETYLKSIQDKLNQVFGRICLEFEVEKKEDLVLDAKNFDDKGILVPDKESGINSDLKAAKSKDCIDIFVLGNVPPSSASGGTPQVPEPPYSMVDDAQAPITFAHELGHFFGWKYLPSTLDSPLFGLYGHVNVCRPKGADKTDLLMYDKANERTDAGLLSEGNLQEMIKLICANAVPK